MVIWRSGKAVATTLHPRGPGSRRQKIRQFNFQLLSQSSRQLIERHVLPYNFKIPPAGIPPPMGEQLISSFSFPAQVFRVNRRVIDPSINCKDIALLRSVSRASLLRLIVSSRASRARIVIPTPSVDDGIRIIYEVGQDIYSYFSVTRRRGSGAWRIYVMFTLVQGC